MATEREEVVALALAVALALLAPDLHTTTTSRSAAQRSPGTEIWSLSARV